MLSKQAKDIGVKRNRGAEESPARKTEKRLKISHDGKGPGKEARLSKKFSKNNIEKKKKVSFSPKPEYIKIQKSTVTKSTKQNLKGGKVSTNKNQFNKTKEKLKQKVNNKFNKLKQDKVAVTVGTKNSDVKNGKEKVELHKLKFKERKVFRKKQENSSYDLSSKVKTIWEDLRREDCPKEKSLSLVSRLMNLVKGHLKELIFAHDTVRVIECLTTHASPAQRSMIFLELKDSILQLAQNKYAKFYLIKVLRCGTKEEKDFIVQAFMGKVIKNIRHIEAAVVLETAYNEHAKAKQRIQLVQEFYGPTFAVFKDQDISNLKDVLDNNPDQKNAILTHMNETLVKLTSKTVLRHSIVHHVLREYLTLADSQGRTEVIEAYKENLPEILHTKDGARSAMMCLWHGTTKDRKIIVKSMKTFVTKIAKEEHGHMVLLALFDCVDDTKLVSKSILNEIIPRIAELAGDPYGRKVLLYLINPRDRLHFHPDVVNILKQGDGNATSKKDSDIRIKELREVIVKPVMEYLKENVTTLLESNFNCLFALTVLQNVEDLTEGYEALINCLIAKPYLPLEGKELHPIEHQAFQLLLKKLLLADSKQDTKKVAFSEVLIKLVSIETMKTWIQCNLGCFLLLRLLESNHATVIEKTEEAMTGMRGSLSDKKYKGAELLLSKLKC